ncbi:hypothetical protein ACP3W2_27700, partial [Salmonella enterica]|uniref:hypothetical protein n=1 Tax=Salmonella enterica TaxID=28901 RepID=UPI003CEB2822
MVQTPKKHFYTACTEQKQMLTLHYAIFAFCTVQTPLLGHLGHPVFFRTMWTQKNQFGNFPDRLV